MQMVAIECRIITAFCIIGAKGDGAMLLTGNVGCKDFVCGAFDGAMAFAAAVSFPWDLVQAFSICYHFPANSLVVHIKESVEQDNDAEFFDS